MAVRTIIADDETRARKRLLSMLSDVPELEIVGEAENGSVAIEMINRLRPDLVLLDIQMPLQNGFDVLEHLVHIPEVIFVTAYDEYAIRAFEVDAVDYLLKPYAKPRLLKAIEKAVRSLNETTDKRARILSVLERYRESTSRMSRISVRSTEHPAGQEFRVFEVNSARLFRAEEGLVFMYVGTRRVIVDLSLQTLEERLDPGLFLRVHRNAIVNLKRISRIFPAANGKLSVELDEGTRVIVSRDRAQKLKSAAGFVRGTPRS